jgi:hypothetical protein
MAAHRARTQPFSIRLGALANLLVNDEVRRSGRPRSIVVEELAEEAAKARLFPGIAFRDGRPRRAWAIGSGLDVWQIVELMRSYKDDEGSRNATPLPLDLAVWPRASSRSTKSSPRVSCEGSGPGV